MCFPSGDLLVGRNEAKQCRVQGSKDTEGHEPRVQTQGALITISKGGRGVSPN